MLFSPCRKSFWQRRQGDFLFSILVPLLLAKVLGLAGKMIFGKNGHIQPSEVSGGVKMVIFGPLEVSETVKMRVFSNKV